MVVASGAVDQGIPDHGLLRDNTIGVHIVKGAA